MSLFKAREWWSTWCGGAEEEFDQGSLCVSNIDNSGSNLDKIIVGSLNGVLRIFTPNKDGFKPDNLMLEMQMSLPILQLETGRYVSGTDQLHLAVLHPRLLCIYGVTSVTGSVEHGHHYTITLMYEHRLERTAASMTCGPFGGVQGKDFICVMSMDGALTFYEQEIFSLQVFLPNLLIPGPITYIGLTDSFVTATSGRNVEAYRYHTLASSSIGDKGRKKVTADWSKSLGEHILDIRLLLMSTGSIVLLGERSLFTMSTSGDIITMKKLEFNPSCFYPYVNTDKSDVKITLVGSHSSSLQIYEGIQLVWAAQLPHVPICCTVGNFIGLSGVVVTLDEYGHLYCSYLGTDPSLFIAPHVEARSGNFEELEKELKQLNAYIKESENGAGKVSTLELKEVLVLDVVVPKSLDEVSKYPEQFDSGEEDIVFPSITVQVVLECKSIKPIENITLLCSAKFPLVCSHPQIDIPIIGNRGPSMTVEVSFYTTGGSLPSNMEATITANYVNDSEAPRVVQSFFELPLMLICRGTSPVKQAQYKLTVDTNKEAINLAEIFPEMVNDAVIPVPVIGIQYIGGPVVTILSSKQSNRYRIQCDLFEGMWLVLLELINRMEGHFSKFQDGTKFKATFQGPLPLPEYFELIDNHFEQRLCIDSYKDLLAQRAHQFRVIQKRLLTRFKDKTPSPLAHIDTLLDGTYKQMLALGEEFENTQLALVHSGNALSSATRLINLLIKLMVSMSESDFTVLGSCLTPVVSDSMEQGWEETVSSNITYLLQTCLAKSVKEQNSALPKFSMEKDTSKLKRHIALMCERLNKGASLSLVPSQSSKTSLKLERRNLSSLAEEDAQGLDSNILGKRLVSADEKQADVVKSAVEKASRRSKTTHASVTAS